MLAVMNMLKHWISSGLAAVTFIIAFKYLSSKTNIPALTSAAGYV